MEADPALRSVGQGRVDPAARQPRVQLVDELGEGRGGKPRNEPPADREAAVRFHQMFATGPHAAAYWVAPPAWQPRPAVGTIDWRDSRELPARSR